MKHFGGRVEIGEPSDGVGACFRLTFSASLERGAAATEIETPKAKRLRILVVDDEPEFVDVVRETLLQNGHEVTGAGDGDDAMSQVARRDFDLILMDLGLPKRNGLEVVRAMRGEGIDSKIVLMTGWDGETVGADPRVSFCDTVLQKPFRRRQLEGSLVVPELIRNYTTKEEGGHGQTRGDRVPGSWTLRLGDDGGRLPHAGAIQPARTGTPPSASSTTRRRRCITTTGTTTSRC